jgi:hypothetical protein
VIDLRNFLPVAVRAWTTRAPEKTRPPRRRPRPADPIRHILVLDTETSVDTAQRLLFGVYRYGRVDGNTVTTVAEGLIYADDLPERDPDGYRILEEYAATRKADTELTYLAVEPQWQLELLSRREFAERWVWRVGNPHGNRRDPATIVMFNAPFDWSRLSTAASEARKDLSGGFSLHVWTNPDGRDKAWRPRVGIKSLDSKRALKKFTSLEVGAHDFAGHLLDLRTLVFALTGASHTLDSACAAFGVAGKATIPELGRISEEAVDYCREDVAATLRLYEAVMAEYRKHPIGLQPTQAYSPASIAKAYLKAFGIRPRLDLQPDFPPELLGAAMSAFYGGRSEIHQRLVPLPVRLVDVTSTYPTMDLLLGLWPLITAERIEPVDVTDEIRHLLATVTDDDCYRPAFWKQLVVLVQIQPDGDILPVRARYAGEPEGPWSIGINPLHGEQPMWFTLPDLIGCILLSGNIPKILRAVRFAAGPTRQAGLRPVRLRGEVEVDRPGRTSSPASSKPGNTSKPPPANTRAGAAARTAQPRRS